MSYVFLVELFPRWKEVSLPVGPGRRLYLYRCLGAPERDSKSLYTESGGQAGPEEKGWGWGAHCAINWRGGKQRGPGCFYCLPTPGSSHSWLESVTWNMPCGPLHQQTANLNAGTVTQVYKQQTVGQHQRLSLKDNRPPPHAATTSTLPHSLCQSFYHNTQPCSSATCSPRAVDCPLLLCPG